MEGGCQYICDEEYTAPTAMTSNRPASTFISTHPSSVTMGCDISNITSGIKLMEATSLPECDESTRNLSTIEERSNEDVYLFTVFDPECVTLLLNRVMPMIHSFSNFSNVSGPLPKLQGASVDLYLGKMNIHVCSWIISAIFFL